MFKYKKIIFLTLFAFCGAGFPFFDGIDALKEHESVLFAASKKSNKTKKNTKKTSSKSEVSEKDKQPEDDTELLLENEKTRGYVPDIYRCPDCGYEQDEPGQCPDHAALSLVKVITDNKDPLAPSEYDGNEDILVDVPLNIQFKKDEIENKEIDTPSDNKKSSKKNKKGK